VGRRTTVAEVREGRTYYGRAWTVGEYPDLIRPSILNVGVGEGGVGILTIMSRLRLADGDIDQVVADYARGSHTMTWKPRSPTTTTLQTDMKSTKD
jgi:hypothetical protein